MNPTPTDAGQMSGLSFVQAGDDLATNYFICCSCFLHFMLRSLVVVVMVHWGFWKLAVGLVVSLGAAVAGHCIDMVG